MPIVELPSGKTAVLRAKTKVKGRDRITGAQMAIAGTEYGQALLELGENPDPADVAKIKPTPDAVATLEGIRRAVVLAYLESWEHPFPPDLDGLGELDEDDYEALSAKAQELEEAYTARKRGEQPNPDPESPTSP